MCIRDRPYVTLYGRPDRKVSEYFDKCNCNYCNCAVTRARPFGACANNSLRYWTTQLAVRLCCVNQWLSVCRIYKFSCTLGGLGVCFGVINSVSTCDLINEVWATVSGIEQVLYNLSTEFF